MAEVRDFFTQTDIPYLSIINSTIWSQHLQQMKFDLKQLVLLTDTFDSMIIGLSDKVIYDIFHIIEHEKREKLLETVTEKLDEINNVYSGYKTAMMTLLKNYSINRVEMFKDLHETSVSNEIGIMTRTGEKIKNDLKMIINVINFYEFDFDDRLAENFHQILSFAVKTCKERSDLIGEDKKDFSKILFTIKEGVLLSGVTNHMGDGIEQTESDRSLKKLSADSLDAKATNKTFDGDIKVEYEKLKILKKRSEDMERINRSILQLREKMKQRVHST